MINLQSFNRPARTTIISFAKILSWTGMQKRRISRMDNGSVTAVFYVVARSLPLARAVGWFHARETSKLIVQDMRWTAWRHAWFIQICHIAEHVVSFPGSKRF
jgi:hypothetical protein